MKRIIRFKKLVLAMIVGVLAVFPATVTQASLIVHIPISTDDFIWTDPLSNGQIMVTEEVFDHFGLDFSLYEWRYTIYNISYEPNPGTSNGLSGFNAVFPAEIPELANQYGPALWAMNCCTAGPPLNAEWDIDNTTGAGIPIGGIENFGFTTAPRFDVVTIGSWMHTWQDNGQTNIFSGDLSVPGDLISVPEPSSLLLLGSGLVGLGLWGRKRFKARS